MTVVNIYSTCYTDGRGSPGAVVALRLSGLVGKSVTTAIIQCVTVIIYCVFRSTQPPILGETGTRSSCSDNPVGCRD